MKGFNTGVALYNLSKMRASEKYGQMASTTGIQSLAEKYRIEGTVGDQDWLTVLGWENQEMFYVLPCEFNRQTDQVYNNINWKDKWDIYHTCEARTKILHNNGE